MLVKKYFKSSCKIIKINYYRFKGFWYDSEYKPYNNFNEYNFNPHKYYGIHNSFNNLQIDNIEDIKTTINNIKINSNDFLNYYNNELKNLKYIDENSDIKMYDFFLKYYKNIKLFNDPFHPTNIFFIEIFKQLIKLIFNKDIIIDENFIEKLSKFEMTHWTIPILPQITSILKLNYDDNYKIFYPNPINMNIYEYYYIRLSKDNFKNYLINHLF